MIECAKDIYKHEGGYRGFWKGFTACGTRAILANGFLFVAYEYTQR